MKNFKFLPLCFLFITNSLILGQIQTDTVFTLKGVPVSFNIDAEGMVLSHITRHKDPFYHASAYMGTVITMKIGSNVSIPLRFVAEVWNFSNDYGREHNLYTWAKPSIQARVNKILGLDSAVFNVGDLWRQKQGQGLIFDHFESQGGEITLYKNRVYLSARDLGYGFTGYDDIATISAGYDSLLAIRYMMNYYNYPVGVADLKIASLDSRVRINKNFWMYEEAAINIDTKAKSALVGFLAGYRNKRSFFNAQLELRYYEKDFFFEEMPQRLPFFISLTVLDKPVNQFYTYMIRNSTNITIGGRFTGRYFINNDFFIDADLEPVAGDFNMFFYEAAIGFEPESNVLLRAGIMNKFLNAERDFSIFYYGSEDPELNDMFVTDKKPFLFAKASFRL